MNDAGTSPLDTRLRPQQSLLEDPPKRDQSAAVRPCWKLN